MQKANQAMNRLTKIWQSKVIDEKQKIHLYQALVSTLLLYAVESRVLSAAQMARLESVQIRHLRRIAKSPAHLTHESNESIRERTKVSSVVTRIECTQLLLWRSVAITGAEEVVASVWGKDDCVDDDMALLETEREQRLLQSLHKLRQFIPQKLSGVDVNAKGEIKMGKNTWNVLQSLTKNEVNKVLEFESKVEGRQKRTFGPKLQEFFSCATCHKKFSTHQGLVSHQVRAHNLRSSQRKLVQEGKGGNGKFKCLLCGAELVDKKGAQLHIDRHCAKKFTPEAIFAKLVEHGLA
jgi:hypothetical protein